jgi:DNA polymerase III subunit beta
MQFSCNQDTFSKYINIVSRIVNNKPGLPILNNVAFETVKGKLLMKATDLELSISTWIGSDVKAEGKVTAPAKQLAEFVNSIPEEKIDMVLVKQNFNISTSNNNASFNTMPYDDFPAIPTVKDKESMLIRINKGDLITAINRVAFAAATDDIKPVLTAIKMEIEGGMVSFVATDGLRLSRQIIKIEKNEKEKSLLIPVRAFEELAYVISSIDSDDEWVSIYLIEERNQILFRFGDVELTSRLIDGEFPEYKQIIPTGFKTQCLLNRDDFINSLKIINIIARSVLGNKMILDISKKESGISLSATQSELGKNQSKFNCDVNGDELKIAFSAKFLSDILNHIDSGDIIFECSEPVRPGVFKIKGDESFVHLVMPMML